MGGETNGRACNLISQYRDNGKESRNDYRGIRGKIGLYRVNIRIVRKTMETTIMGFCGV